MIQTTIDKQKKEHEVVPYPKLMEAKDIGVIVLAINKTTVVHLTGDKIGFYTNKWNMDASVVDFVKSLTLKNQQP